MAADMTPAPAMARLLALAPILSAGAKVLTTSHSEVDLTTVFDSCHGRQVQ